MDVSGAKATEKMHRIMEKVKRAKTRAIDQEINPIIRKYRANFKKKAKSIMDRYKKRLAKDDLKGATALLRKAAQLIETSNIQLEKNVNKVLKKHLSKNSRPNRRS